MRTCPGMALGRKTNFVKNVSGGPRAEPPTTRYRIFVTTILRGLSYHLEFAWYHFSATVPQAE